MSQPSDPTKSMQDPTSFPSTFTRITPAIYIYDPPSLQTTSSITDPDLVFLCMWLNAPPRHIAKYTAYYTTRYPTSRILLITSSILDTMRSIESRAKSLNPALPFLLSIFPSPPSQSNSLNSTTFKTAPKLLLHAFSNGGSLAATMLARAYHVETGFPLPLTATVLDSAPGKARYEAVVRALSVGLPKNFIARFVGLWILRCVLTIQFMRLRILGETDQVEICRVELNDVMIMGGQRLGNEKMARRENVEETSSGDSTSKEIEKSGKMGENRLYIYGTADLVVDWRDVEEHIEEAKQKGWMVREEKYEGTGHTAHLINDAERYWNSVERLWKDSI